MAFLNSYDSELKKPFPKQIRLKDYLLDDLSSCSSNGFRSFPRRQCCTTVRFLLEIDLKTKDSNQKQKLLESNSKSASTTMSAFQRASEAVINAVKLLPFVAAKPLSNSSQQSKNKSSILPRSLSRKLKRTFWKRTGKEIERWKSFKYFLEERENPNPSVLSPPHATTTAAAYAVTTASGSTSSVSECNSNSHSDIWTDCDFISDDLQSSSGNYGSPCETDVVTSKKRLPEKPVSKRVTVTVGGDSIEATNTTPTSSKNKWQIEEEKEQFSPVSVLDFPSPDEEEEEEEEVSSPFQYRLTCVEGRKKKLMHKIQRFESLAQLEPLDLAKEFSLSEHTDELLESPLQPRSASIQDMEEDENKMECKAVELLEQMKTTFHNFTFDPEILLLDFFKEGILGSNGNRFENELVNEAKDWINGSPHEMFLGWEVQQNRQAYIRDMEKGGRWNNFDEHKEEVAIELEVEVIALMVNELVLDLTS